MNEMDIPELTDKEIDAWVAEDIGDAQQANDEERFRSTIEHILRKCENGMCTQDDVFELRSCLRYYGIDV